MSILITLLIIETILAAIYITYINIKYKRLEENHIFILNKFFNTIVLSKGVIQSTEEPLTPKDGLQLSIKG